MHGSQKATVAGKCSQAEFPHKHRPSAPISTHGMCRVSPARNLKTLYAGGAEPARAATCLSELFSLDYIRRLEPGENQLRDAHSARDPYRLGARVPENDLQ